MVSELDFSTYNEVMLSWNRIRRVKDYSTTLGFLVFTKFFSMYPETISIFGFKTQGEAMKFCDSKSFQKLTKNFVVLFDSVIDMLGPNADMLTDVLMDLGRTHNEQGIKLEHYPAMGIALIDALRTLDKKFTPETELCWRQVYLGISLDMGKAAIQ
mmetsp:Transcript_6254/g.15477  ORF Transcript_6254/g.15477 Transcript_6254/m.15477 type:complete len:156 (+) Transcript_6254:121-588(+)|eukprot:CAMPEP_0197181444 /NCGR_PEP_ID=MMETSP1423-20130617/5728_1 /TAXON_ID=476441 /ORGANISM="Pseudo-nitzschia heimii, Strain UNC1101" /LENGTH=155 /DNA_ID=CAMNT_0042631695 /DNA_START=96 /DNA_END=563 /DNA_ORIENTATION=+